MDQLTKRDAMIARTMGRTIASEGVNAYLNNQHGAALRAPIVQGYHLAQAVAHTMEAASGQAGYRRYGAFMGAVRRAAVIATIELMDYYGISDIGRNVITTAHAQAAGAPSWLSMSGEGAAS